MNKNTKYSLLVLASALVLPATCGCVAGALYLFFSIVRFEANWDRFKTAAGPIRNEKMAKYAAGVDRKMLIAFWDGQSKGTGSMIDLAKKHGIEVYIVNI